jgi:hypothetical protein
MNESALRDKTVPARSAVLLILLLLRKKKVAVLRNNNHRRNTTSFECVTSNNWPECRPRS